MPSTDPVEALSYEDAQQQLKQSPYYSEKWMNKDFKVKVSVTVGEFLGKLRPRDKGNDFTLEITYEYYGGKTSETIETMYTFEDAEKDFSEKPLGWGLIIPTGFFGRS